MVLWQPWELSRQEQEQGCCGHGIAVVLHGQQSWEGRRICAELSHPQVPVSAWGGREDVVWHSRAASVPLAGVGQLAAGRDITTGTATLPSALGKRSRV